MKYDLICASNFISSNFHLKVSVSHENVEHKIVWQNLLNTFFSIVFCGFCCDELSITLLSSTLCPCKTCSAVT